MPPLTTSSGRPTGAIKGVSNMMMNLKNENDGSSIVTVFDAKGKTFRSDIYSDYKANRPPMPDELRLQLDPIKSICKAIGFPIVEIEGVEADDVIATIVKIAKEEGYSCVISSLDKDLMQLVEDPAVSMINTMTNKKFNEKDVIEKFGVKPSQIRDMLALVGDSSDNIPGVPKVGQKTAAKWLNEFGDLESIKENAPSIKGVVGENLRNSLNTVTQLLAGAGFISAINQFRQGNIGAGSQDLLFATGSALSAYLPEVITGSAVIISQLLGLNRGRGRAPMMRPNLGATRNFRPRAGGGRFGLLLPLLTMLGLSTLGGDANADQVRGDLVRNCLLYTSPSPRDS